MSWYPHTVTAAAGSEPVTAAEAKSQTRVDGTADDTALGIYIAAARAHVEAYCGTPLVSRTITAKCDSFDDFALFPVVPLASVSSVAYVDGAGDAQTLSTSVYEVRSDGLTASLALKSGQSWPTIQTGSRITVTASVGYSSIPADVKHAMLLLIGHWFANREAAGEQLSSIPHGVDELLANHRAFSF